MEIEAIGTLRLQYIEDSIFLGNPALSIIVTFKDPTKFFRKKVKIVERLRVKANDESMEAFLNRVEKLLENKDSLVKKVENEVSYYFYEKYRKITNSSQIDEIQKKISEIGNISVKVKV